MRAKKLTANDLDSDRIDERWTVTKLLAAGWRLEWERTCRTCGDQIEGYRHGDSQRMLILDAAVLSPHTCEH